MHHASARRAGAIAREKHAAMSKPEYRVALAIVHRDDLFLVARRRPDAHLGGLWEFPGGKCESDESAADAATRELWEECHVRAIAERVLRETVCDYDDRVVRLTPVVCRWTDGEAQPLGSEICRWVSADELLALDMPAINSGIVVAALRALGIAGKD